MRINTAARSNPIRTHEGGPAKRLSVEQTLRRSVLSCLLWEDEFYEDGKTIAERIISNAALARQETVAALAIEARTVYGLRHAPLLLLLDLIRRGGPGVADAIDQSIRRVDEIAELVALYWRDGRKMLPRQMKLGLSKAFARFDEYALAKYDREGAVKLRDVLFMIHAKPDEGKADLYKRLADRKLATPDTWEVGLSAGADKKSDEDKRVEWDRLLREGKLGYLALLRNLRNMVGVGVDRNLIAEAIVARRGGAEKVWPFRYVAAARAVPQLEAFIDQALCEAIASGPRLSGHTVILVDVSHSMNAPLSAKSDMKRMDAAAALASVVNGDVRVFTFSSALAEVPPRRGMAGVDAVIKSQPHQNTYLGAAVAGINKNVKYDRMIVITDEQSADRVPDPTGKYAYMINVASNKNGVGYGRWTHIDGFSEAVIRYITEAENDG